MATVITVHGTNASGSEHGDKWWQRDSPFEKHLRQLVASADGELHFKPFIWDGLNSETSRRTAAISLAALLKRLEASREPYCLIGHSHGGSIVAHSLMYLVRTARPQKMLAKWITVGTPFISFSKSPLLFSRLGLIGKSVYVTFLTYVILILTAFILAYRQPGQTFTYDIRLVILVFGSFAAPFLVAYGVLWLVARRRLYMYRRKNTTRFAKAFSHLWLPLWHTSDEAICGLRAIKDLKLAIFSRRFAAGPFAFASIFVIPATIAALSAWPDFMNKLNTYMGGAALPGGGTDYTLNLVVFASLILRPVFPLFDNVPSHVLLAYGLILTAGPFALFAVSLVVTYVVGWIARGLSFLASVVLNKMTLEQIRKSALGSDTPGEFARNAMECPTWLNAGFAPLPAALGDDISALSDREAAKSLAKFRNALGHLTFSEGEADKQNFVQSYMGWNELIHTCYFNVPRFCKLVAYAISTADGFRAKEEFKSDPDYALVKSWFEEIQPKADVPGALAGGRATAEVASVGRRLRLLGRDSKARHKAALLEAPGADVQAAPAISPPALASSSLRWPSASDDRAFPR
jgi:hypothetical protein